MKFRLKVNQTFEAKNLDDAISIVRKEYKYFGSINIGSGNLISGKVSLKMEDNNAL